MVEYLENFLTNMAVKEFWKSVHICQSYDKKSSVLFFWRHSVGLPSALYIFRSGHRGHEQDHKVLTNCDQSALVLSNE